MAPANTSKIPGLRPVSASASGSPRQPTISAPPRASVSPFGTSRLPRLLQTPTTHRSSLPVGALTPFPATNKPLPSPPVAQVVDPNSPPKAARTLVDAYCGTTAWPALQPENIPTRTSSKHASLPLLRVPSPTGSVVSNDTWSQAAGSSLDGEEDEGESEIRIKRLSWRTSGSGSGTGPVLTIQPDAEAVIMGNSDDVPDVPAIPIELPDRPLQPRSLSSLAGRLSRHTTSRLSSINTSSSPAPAAADAAPSSSPGVKISPIRSMQPPRKASFETPTKTSRLPLVSPTLIRKTSDTSQKSTMTTAGPEKTGPGLSTVPESHSLCLVASNKEPVAAPIEPIEAPYELAEALSEPVAATSQPADVPSEPVVAPESGSVLDDRNAEKVDITVDETDAPQKEATNPRNHRDSTSRVRLRKSTSSALPRTPCSQDTAGTHGPSKLRISETAHTISIDSPLGRGTPKSRLSRIPRSSQASSSSPLQNASTDQANVKNSSRVKGVNAKMVKAKRSVRNLFKRGEKSTKTPEPVTPRQGFMSGTRSSLAKVIRDSKSLSRVNLSMTKRGESRSEMRPRSSGSRVSVEIPSVPAIATRATPPVPDTRRQSVLSVPEAREVRSVPDIRRQSVLSISETPAAGLLQEAPPDTIDATGSSILRMIRSQETLPRDSSERLRILEIAECVINVIQCTRDAKVSAIQARMHARQAELYAQRVGVELKQLQQHQDGIPFCHQTRRIITGLVKNAELADIEAELREALAAETLTTETEEMSGSQVASTSKDGCLQNDD